MDTRRSRHPSRSDAIAMVRWLGWVMLMMFVLVQTAQAAAGDTPSATSRPSTVLKARRILGTSRPRVPPPERGDCFGDPGTTAARFQMRY
jgi:hypothetical protein